MSYIRGLMVFWCEVGRNLEISQELCASHSYTCWEVGYFCQAPNIYLRHYMLRLAGYDIFVEFILSKYLDGWLLSDVSLFNPWGPFQ